MRHLINTSCRLIATSVIVLTVVLCSNLDATAQQANFDETSLMPAEMRTGDNAAIEASAVSSETWRKFSSSLVLALEDGDDDIRGAAMRFVIQFAEFVDVDPAISNLTRIYRNHGNEQMRRLAVVAIAATENRKGINFLRRSFAREKSNAIKHTIGAVLLQYDSEASRATRRKLAARSGGE